MENDSNHESGSVDIETSKEIFHTLAQKLSQDNEKNERRSSNETAIEGDEFNLHQFVNVSWVMIDYHHLTMSL